MNLVTGSLILAWLLYFCAFIAADVWQLCEEQASGPPVCSGCLKGRVVPGCPVHDPQERRRNGEESQADRSAEAS